MYPWQRACMGRTYLPMTHLQLSDGARHLLPVPDVHRGPVPTSATSCLRRPACSNTIRRGRIHLLLTRSRPLKWPKATWATVDEAHPHNTLDETERNANHTLDVTERDADRDGVARRSTRAWSMSPGMVAARYASADWSSMAESVKSICGIRLRTSTTSSGDSL